tara:strand:- start:336 stop:836 length:501 start_codon:yes stop_codon:yes gene_type:complete
MSSTVDLVDLASAVTPPACIRLRFPFPNIKKKMGFSVTRALQELEGEDRCIATRRVALVHAAQRRIGMEPRDDSRLTFNYSTGALTDEDVPSTIASELVIVHAIYEKTRYGALLKDVLDALALHIRKKYRIPWNDVWDVARFYGSCMLKLHCYEQMAPEDRDALRR